MSEERLHFGAGAPALNAMELVEHFVRYAMARSLVQGRCVLDVACGEGYGSWLLKEWGASEVIGLDVSAEAIECARRNFARADVHFVLGPTSSPFDALEAKAFDLIVCLETLEHVADPLRFLHQLKASLNQDGVILMSCPNDHATTRPEESNPFHLRKYTLQEFQLEAESVLGPASGWFVGTNALGYAVVPLGFELAEQEWRDPRAIIRSELLAAGHVVPSQHNTRPDPSSVFFYAGVWGQASLQAPLAALALQSYTAFAEPWRALEWFKTERESIREALKQREDEIPRLQARVEIVASERASLQEALDQREKEAAVLQGRCASVASRLTAALGEVQRLRHEVLAKNRLVSRVTSLERRRREELECRLSASFVEATRLAQEAEQTRTQLSAIVNSRGYRMLDRLYYSHLRGGALERPLRALRAALKRVLGKSPSPGG